MNGKILNAKYLAVVLLGVAILLIASFDAFSQSEIDLGGTLPVTVKLKADVYREVVSYEPYETTCTRQVYDGMSQVCTSSGGPTETKCRKISGVGIECWEEGGGESCSMEPSYSTETYSCIEQRRVVDNVYDHEVRAVIEVEKGVIPANIDLNNCKLNLGVNSISESYSAKCLSALVRVRVLKKDEVKVGRDEERTIKIALDFSTIEELNALKHGMSGLSYSKGIITFETANLAEVKNFKLNAELIRNRFLLKDKVLLKRELKSTDYSVEKLEKGKAKISINIAKLVAFEPKKKHTFKISLSTVTAVDLKGVINYPSLSNSESRSVVINE